MNQTFENKFSTYTRHFAGFVIRLVFVLIVILFVFYSPLSTGSSATNFSSNWRNADGELISLAEFTYGEGTEAISHKIYKTLSSVDENTILIFYARNMYANVYINDNLISEDAIVENPIYGTSPGIRWHFVVLEPSDSPVTICIEGTAVYSDAAGLINDIFLGEPQEVLFDIFAKHMFAFCFSVLLLLISICFLILYFYFHSKYHIGREFVLLGLSIFFTSLWCSTDTRMWQLFFGHSEVFHMITYLSFFSIPLAFLLLAVTRFEGKLKNLTDGLILTSAIIILASTILHFAGLIEFHFTIKINHILLVLIVPILIKLILSYRREDAGKSNHLLQLIAVVTLLICLFAGLLRYRLGYYDDNSTYVQIALVGFLICMITYHLNLMAHMFKNGTKAEMLRNLALTDYMSGMYNRTAFAEHRVDYEDALTGMSKVGIIQFDINNLKTTNDSLGHEKGDLLIQLVSTGLKEAFSDKGNCYRMGGDEFMVILTGKNPSHAYEKGLAKFLGYCEEQSKDNPELIYPIEVAYGYVLDFSISLSDAMDLADVRMYEHKKKLKSQE